MRIDERACVKWEAGLGNVGAKMFCNPMYTHRSLPGKRLRDKMDV